MSHEYREGEEVACARLARSRSLERSRADAIVAADGRTLDPELTTSVHSFQNATASGLQRLNTLASDTSNHDVADRSHVLTRCTITRDHTEHSAGWSRCSAMRIVVHDSDALLLKEQRGRVAYAVRFPASAPAGPFGPCTPGRALWCSPPTAKARRLRGRCRSGLPSATPSAARPRCARKLRPLRRRPVRTGAPLPIPVLRLASPC